MSMASLTSTASAASSNGSKRRRHYRIVSRASSVDELLFGKSTQPRSREDKIAPQFQQKSNSANTRRQQSEQDVIQVITKDMIRKLRIPRQDPSGTTIVLAPSEYGRIKSASRVMSKEEKLAHLEMLKREKKALHDACEDRKNMMQTYENNRQHNEKLSDLEKEAKEKSQYLLEKAQEQMEEQEDEIKKLNELILNAKCHAIRDAQLVEKVEIQKELLEEEKRLDEMMESDRIRALKDYEEREQAKRVDRLAGAQVLHQQIEIREQQRLLDDEKKDQETMAMLQYLEKLKEEDMESLVKKREIQRVIMSDVARANQEIQAQKDLIKQQDQMAEVKVMEYLKEKSEREKAFEEEKEKARIEKEKEIARLRAQQERAKDKQAERDALRAKRNQEEAEREWRKKERSEAKKKNQTETMLKNARQEQVQNKEHFLAVQAARDRAEFERVLNAQVEQVAKDEFIESEMQKRRQKFSYDVRQQIHEKEKDRVHARNSFFEEGIKLDQEAKERRRKLDEIKRRKLVELKSAGVPNKYVNEVARRIDAPVEIS